MARSFNVCFVAFGLVAMVLLKCTAAQTVHVVGGDAMGWNVPQGGAQAYVNWANGKTFMVGDILEFNFVSSAHDVLQVPKASFDACTEANPIGQTITTGPANITLNSTGDHYYICTIGTHCQLGQKLAISVSGTPGSATPPSTTPTTPTAPTTPTSPSPGSPDAPCPPTPASSPEAANGPTGSNPTPPPPPSSSASHAFASVFVSIVATATALFF